MQRRSSYLGWWRYVIFKKKKSQNTIEEKKTALITLKQIQIIAQVPISAIESGKLNGWEKATQGRGRRVSSFATPSKNSSFGNIGQDGRTFTHNNEVPWRAFQAWTLHKSATIREQRDEYGEVYSLKSLFRNTHRLLFQDETADFCS